MNNKPIVIACDHAGVELKKEINLMLAAEGYGIIDCGVNSLDSVDYPDVAEKLALEVLKNNCPGIIICGTGIGVSIAVNKVPGIRAALCHNEYTARMAREHNDANVIAMGARVIGVGLAIEMIKTFLNTEFTAGRHNRRVEKIKNIEEKNRGRI